MGATGEATTIDRFERAGIGWYLLLDGAIAANVVLAASPKAYEAAAARVPVPPRRIVQAFVAGTVVVHVAEAMVARRRARSYGMDRSALAWTLGTFVVGFPSLLQQRRVARSAASQVGA
jgi:hypothetical protein